MRFVSNDIICLAWNRSQVDRVAVANGTGVHQLRRVSRSFNPHSALLEPRPVALALPENAPRFFRRRL